MTNGDMDTKERSRIFVQGFQLDLWGCVTQRLEIVIPTHVQGESYAVDEISDATRYILFGTSTEVCPKALQPAAITPTPLVMVPPLPPIKTEPTSFPIDAWAQALARALLPQGGAQM